MDSNLPPTSTLFKWLIVLASFFNHMMTIGLVMFLSVLYVAWQAEFQESKAMTSWILSIAGSILMGFGPLPAMLSARFGFRRVAFAGGLLTGFGLAVSVFATSSIFLIVSIGIVVGIGTSFCYLIAVAVVPLHFDKHRSLAMGIGTTGVGFGAFAFGPLIDYLEKEYTWRGALLLTGAISLNLCVTSMLFSSTPTSQGGDDMENEEFYEVPATSKGNGNVVKEQNVNYSMPVPSIEIESVDDSGKLSINQVDRLQRVPFLPGTKARRQKYKDALHSSLNDLRPKGSSAACHSSSPALDQQGMKKTSSNGYSEKSLHSFELALMSSASSLQLFKHSGTEEEESTHRQSMLTSKESHFGNDSENQGIKNTFLFLSIVKSHLLHLRDPSFFLYCVSNFFACLSYFTPVIFLVDRAVFQGLDVSTGALLVSLAGGGNIFGRLFAGAIADSCLCSNRMFMFVLVLCSQGSGTMLSSFCGGSPVLHGAYALFFGMHMGFYSILSALVTIDLKGVSNIAAAYGLALAFMGLAALVGPPFAGWLFDWTRSYKWTYITNGAFLMISGLMCLPLIRGHPRR